MPSRTCAHPERAQETLFRARDYITGDPFHVRRCAVCGLVRTLPRPAGEAADRYYPQGYYGGARRYPRPLEWLLDRLYASRARRIERRSGLHGGSVLDVGCGRGWLLARLRCRGWTVAGTELSDAAARYARDVLHLDVRTGDLAQAGIRGSFDLVILWHVLEHVPEPDSLLRQVAAILRPGGTLLVSVPNAGSLEARWGGASWFHLDVPRHLNHFTPDTLAGMLKGAGLLPYRYGYVALEYDSFSVAQTVLNRLGVRHNLLYDLIRSRSAKILSPASGGSARDLALTLLLTPPLLAISPLWLALAVLLRQGATVTVYARKEAS
jgi:SAM-dependent methyltransferase